MLVKVTQKHIDKGRPADCSFCPIANALRELLHEDYYPHVSSAIYQIKETNTGLVVKEGRLPAIAVDFISSFDGPIYLDRSESKPFEFDIYIPSKCLKGA